MSLKDVLATYILEVVEADISAVDVDEAVDDHSMGEVGVGFDPNGTYPTHRVIHVGAYDLVWDGVRWTRVRVVKSSTVGVGFTDPGTPPATRVIHVGSYDLVWNGTSWTRVKV